MRRIGLTTMALVAAVALGLGGCGKTEPAKTPTAATAAADGKYKCGKCNGTKDLKKGDAIPECCKEPMKAA